ncbi:phosphatidate cytidylyltransferase [Halobacillus sp. ACCC02827]|uniref:phosphatidate cytidylyltransferase n=1 Tax=Bacillaceae TaxID=186817 RepID=UPI0002A51C53|nr:MULTISPECIES: phosphatidate cytidylyltransferase [Bacillaceae]ELK44776.1 phosphatidate cytidylyltransferase [Halobacillus sp. BAB-2008]QHT46687.1 phosphatidate cytidylyltransferase [Bacillus sp. SB49]WJE17498.1 phosphatidate cytidylyltransferase [Halobacillus sp. ACCC02827]
MKQRTITAVVAALIFIPIIMLGGWPFQAFVYIIASIALLELIRMKKIARYSVAAGLGLLLMWALMFPYEVFDGIVADEDLITKSEITLLAVLVLLSYTVLVKNRFTFDDAGFLLLSAIYIGMGFNYLIETQQAGLEYVFFSLFVVWATDTGAYLFGRSFGKHKLWPQISPKKTIEGSIGGIVLACIVAVLFQWVYPLDHSLIVILLVTILVSIAGQIGDLVESAFKRHYAVKDSGKILPGHGGVLDRFDSLIFILPILHLINFITV